MKLKRLNDSSDVLQGATNCVEYLNKKIETSHACGKRIFKAKHKRDIAQTAEQLRLFATQLEAAIETATDVEDEERFTRAQIKLAVDLLKHVMHNGEMCVVGTSAKTHHWKDRAGGLHTILVHSNVATVKSLDCLHRRRIKDGFACYVTNIDKLTRIANALPKN